MKPRSKNQKAKPVRASAGGSQASALKNKRVKKIRRVAPRKSKDIFVTQEMLYEVRDELKSSISSLEHKMESRFKAQEVRFIQIDQRFQEMDTKFEARFEAIDRRFEEMEAKFEARFEAIDRRFEEMEAKFEARFEAIDRRFDAMEAKFEARFQAIESKFEAIESKIDQVMATIHRVALLVEEQNARNIFVLDGYTSLNDRVDRLEKKVFGST